MNIIGLMIGKKSSSGVPGKNISFVLNKRLCEYGLIAANKSKYIKKIYVSTDCPTISEVSKKYNANIISRPSSLHDPETLTEDVLSHAHKEILKREKNQKIDLYVLLYANGAFINNELIDTAIEKIKEFKDFDSCVGVVEADMFTPIRAKKINENNELLPFVELSYFDKITSNRDSAGKVFFIDLSLQIIKPHCFEKMDGNQKPFLWLGKKILPLKKDFGGDLDATWQYPVLESWIKKNEN